MADSNDGQHHPPARQRRSVAGEALDVRAPADDDVFYIRLPIATTGEVRNEGDSPLTRAELRGMAQQITERTVNVFPDHGGTTLGGPTTEYSIMEMAGEWEDAEVRDHGESNFELVATARLADPESMPAAAGRYREMLTVLKEQARRGFSQAASIGWRDDGAYPGGVDLMEASLVGIGADPRTSSDGDDAVTLARAAGVAAAHEDPEAVVETFREVVSRQPPHDRPLGPPEDPDRFEDFDACVDSLAEDPDLSREDAEDICGAWDQATDDQAARVDSNRAEYEVGDSTVTIDPPDAVVNAAEAGLDAKVEYDGLADCGTGVGETRARQLIGDEVGPQVIEEVAAYLTSHEEDVNGITDPPTDWGEATWTDGCGPVQYALWGGTATGTGLEWAQDRANAVAEARDEDLPYPDRAARNLDDPEFSEGDPVRWTFSGATVHGLVSDIGAEFTVSGNTITGDDGEAVYLIHDWDDDVGAYDRDGTAKPESSLSASQMDMPPADEDNFMSASDPPGEETAGTDAEQDAPADDDAGETTNRAPDDIDEADVAEFVSETYDGVDGADIQAAMADAGADYTGLSRDTLGWFMGDVLDITAGEAEELIAATAGEEQEMGDDDEMEDDDDDDDRTLKDEVATLRDELADVRDRVAAGDPDAVEDPDGETETRDADGDPDDTDSETRSADEQDAPDQGDDATGLAWRA